MNRSIKTVLIIVVAALAVFVGAQVIMQRLNAPTGTVAGTAGDQVTGPGPFDGLGVRYDGHYRCERGSLRYLLRFFPEGRVVLVNGTKDVEATLPDFLIRETKGDPSIGLHNVMATVKEDSIFFVTKPMRGEISYRGKVTANDRVHFFRHSHITGADFDMEYLFISDEERKSGQQPS
jgi:hypothetical protein